MFGKLLTKIFGSRNERTLKGFKKIASQVNELEEAYQKLTDAELKAKTASFRER